MTTNVSSFINCNSKLTGWVIIVVPTQTSKVAFQILGSRDVDTGNLVNFHLHSSSKQVYVCDFFIGVSIYGDI